MTTNTTRKYHGLKAAVSAAKAWGYNYGAHTQIAYDPAEDRVLYEDNMGNTHCTWTDGIINIGDFAGNGVTMAQVKDAIDKVVAGLD